ncbi:MAG: hypothetical protein QM775_21855 [Pirellulales bacterium]
MLNGTSSSGWTGSTTIGYGTTLSLAGSNQGLLNTSGITLNGGGITLTSVNNTEGALDRVAAVPITSNGGQIVYTNTAVTSAAYNEVLGTLALTTGRLGIVATNTMTSGTQTLTFGAGSLTHAAANSSTLMFGGASLGVNAFNRIVITGEATTAANQIIGPWATWARTWRNKQTMPHTIATTSVRIRTAFKRRTSLPRRRTPGRPPPIRTRSAPIRRWPRPERLPPCGGPAVTWS